MPGREANGEEEPAMKNFNMCDFVETRAEAQQRYDYRVEEKIEKYFGCLARCEANFCSITLKNQNFGSKLNENAEIDSAKI